MKAKPFVNCRSVLSCLFCLIVATGCPQPDQPGGRDPEPEFMLLQDGTYVPTGSSFALGEICTLTVKSMTFTIKNMGTDELNLTGIPDLIALSGADAACFTVPVQPSTPLSAGDRSDFSVRFCPSSSGLKDATISIEHDDVDATPYTFSLSGTGYEPAVRLPATGQTISHASGDDGDHEAGVSWPVPRFTENLDDLNNPDGTVTDNLTGLMWEQVPANSLRTWDYAITYANDLSLGGHTDWRLANIRELQSLVNAGQSNSASWLNGLEFSGVGGSSWSSNTSPSDFNMACVLTVDSGTIIRTTKTIVPTKYAWAVRGGQGGLITLPKSGQTSSYALGDDGDLRTGVSWPSPRFKNNGDLTFTDDLTGLVWEQYPSTTKKNWPDALTYANDLILGDYSDWRLANKNELWSLIDYGSWDNTDRLFMQGFRDVQSDFYWTSTTYSSDTDKAWVIYLDSGNTVASSSDKTVAVHYAWAVCGGQ